MLKVNKKNHKRIVHPEKEKPRIKSLVFNTDIFTDEDNAPTAGVS